MQNMLIRLAGVTGISLSCLFTSVSPCLGQVRFGGSGGGLSTYGLEDVAALAGRPGTALVVLRNDSLGVTIGEKLVGQVNHPAGNFDVISGRPDVPLRMDRTIDAVFGINLVTIFNSTIVNGLGSLGFPHRDAVGEGALTILYDLDQRMIGFDVVGATSGSLRLEFFNRLGESLGHFEMVDPVNDTFIYSSPAADIAAVTINNTDFGGLGLDNLLFTAGTTDRASVCRVDEPVIDRSLASMPTLTFQSVITDPLLGDALRYLWITDCPGPIFDNDQAPTTTLTLDQSGGCRIQCGVSLIVDNGVQSDVCSAAVVLDGTGGFNVTCPPNTTVEADGLGNLADLTAWLNGAATDGGQLSNDFMELVYGCGLTGSVTVNWMASDNGLTGCGNAGCASTFTIADSTPPMLELGGSSMVVEDLDCTGFQAVVLPEFTVADAAGDVVVTHDAPAVFPIGTTTVTFTATDECGNVATASVDVTVLGGAGLDVQVTQPRREMDRDADSAADSKDGMDDDDADAPERDGDSDVETHTDDADVPVAGATVLVFDRTKGSCARGLMEQNDEHADGQVLLQILDVCRADYAGVTDDNGKVEIATSAGLFLVIAASDMDQDGVLEVLAGKRVGRIECGRWREVRLSPKKDERHKSSDNAD